MGYCSDVGLCLNPEATQLFNKALESLSPEFAEKIKEFLNDANKYERDGAVCFCWDWIKWYDVFDDVKFIQDFIADLEFDKFLFIRLGDDVEDTEMYGRYYGNPFNMTLDRRIYVNDAA